MDGADVDAQRAIGRPVDEAAAAGLRERLRDRLAIADGAAVDDVVAGAYRVLATAPCMVLAAGLDDVLGVVDRPNMPGTTDEWPNWRLPLPCPLEDLMADERVRRVAAALRRPQRLA